MAGGMGMCMAGGHVWQVCVCVWQGGVHGRGMCMAGGHVCHRGGMVGETATAADSMHPTGMHSCLLELLVLHQH